MRQEVDGSIWSERRDGRTRGAQHAWIGVTATRSAQSFSPVFCCQRLASSAGIYRGRSMLSPVLPSSLGQPNRGSCRQALESILTSP